MKVFGAHGVVPTIDKKIVDFLQGISRARSRVLMLDYDGTLAPFCIDPDRATPYAQIPELLVSLRRDTDTKLMIVAGRPAHSAARLLGIAGIEIWGCHGLERLSPDGTLQTPELDPRSLQALTAAAELLRESNSSRSISQEALRFTGGDEKRLLVT